MRINHLLILDAAKYKNVVQLYPLKSQVDKFNEDCLGRLVDEGPMYQYRAIDVIPAQIKDRDTRATLLRQESIFPELLTLRRNAQVMLLRNMNAQIGLVNGAVGHIENFVPVALEHLMQSARGRPLSHQRWTKLLEQAQKLDASLCSSLDEAVIWLPRVRFPMRNQLTLPDDFVVNFDDPLAPHIHHDSISVVIGPHYEHLHFHPQHNILQEEEDSARTKNDTYRLQLPLSLAWAFSIHKSQGQTMDRVQVDVKHIFEHGQVYVALSRAKTLMGLRVTGYADMMRDYESDPLESPFWKLMRHSRVEQFNRCFLSQ